MESANQPELPEPNPVTQAAYKKQIRVEIFLPLALTLLLSVVVIALVIISGTGDASVWADVAIVFIAIPILILGLLFLAATIASVFGLYKALDFLPSITVQGQDLSLKLRQNAQMVADRLADPVKSMESINTSVRAAIASIKSIFRRP